MVGSSGRMLRLPRIGLDDHVALQRALFAAAIGFSVQAAHPHRCRRPMPEPGLSLRQDLTATFASVCSPRFSSDAQSAGRSVWLGGNADIVAMRTLFPDLCTLAAVLQLNYLSGACFDAVATWRLPSMLSVLMCVLDVIVQCIVDFPVPDTCFWAVLRSTLPGAGMGVVGASWWYGCRPKRSRPPDDGLSLPPVARTGLEARARQFFGTAQCLRESIAHGVADGR